MSIQAIHEYHKGVHKIYQYGGVSHEQAIKGEFCKLINVYCEKRNLFLVQEITINNKRGKVIRPDGIIRNNSRVNYGYWESKANVDLEKEINAKINSGYPLDNTLFQDEKAAILYQDNSRVLESPLDNEQALDKLLVQFIHYESEQVKAFNNAIEQFKKDLPKKVLNPLRDIIAAQEKTNKEFISSREHFLLLCQNSINPSVTLFDVNEMLLQHILTEDIFTSIFNNSQFHRENNIAKELYHVEDTFFKGATKRNVLQSIESYYSVIKANAAIIHDHHDKQAFLKMIYEQFYKAYNPKAADKQGIVYTPNEIVNFQIESVDYLLFKHFGETLNSKGIKILDPCTGTGTYICDLIEYLSPLHLENKYKHDIYANELGLLPYYIANLNIEYTYQQKMNKYIEIDSPYQEQKQLLEFISKENTKRIKNQNKEKISVIIGNPPYNANQQNENDNNRSESVV